MYFTPTFTFLRGKCQVNYNLMIAIFTTLFMCTAQGVSEVSGGEQMFAVVATYL